METYEGKDIEFKVQDRIFYYRFKFTGETADVVEISARADNAVPIAGYDFQQMLPISRTVFRRLLGGWIRKHISIANGVRNSEYIDDPATRKLNSYAYLRSRHMSGVLANMIWDTFKTKWELYPGHLQEIDNMAYRLVQGRRKMNHIYRNLLGLSFLLKPEVYNILKKDVSKYPTAFGVEIIESMGNPDLPDTVSAYNQILKGISDIFKKNRYGLHFFSSDFIKGYTGRLPTNRWQWFSFRVAMGYLERENVNGSLWKEQCNDHRIEFSKKMLFSDIAVWHYFKKHMHISGPYNTKQIRHMYQVVLDGDRIYKQREDNLHKIAFVPIEGSAMRMVRNAIYNHRQEQELSKTKRLSVKDRDLAAPSIILPDWIESIRIKTAHQLILAGIECQHCIGSYVHYPDIFVREGDVCAQIDRDSLQVMQCYDKGDQITPAADALRKKLNKSLSFFRSKAHER